MLMCRIGHPLKTLFLSSISHGCLFKSPQILRSYTTISSFLNSNDEPPNPHSAVVDFLMHSVGFTKEAAIAASNKVSSLKSTKNPQLVINILKQYGLDNTHIKHVISCAPNILNCLPNKNLEPKFRFLRENGLSGSDLVDIMKRNPRLLGAGLDTQIIPVIGIIRRLVGTNEEAIEVIKKSNWLFSTTSPACLKYLSANVSELQNRGLSNKQVLYLITTRPRCVTLNPSAFNSQLVWIVEELGIPDNSPKFTYAVSATIGVSKSTLEKKLKILRSYKWCEEEIATFVRSYPKYLSYSEARICEGLNFFMKDLGYAATYLATHPLLLGSSLEKKVKPRYKVLNVLKEKKLVDSKYHLALLVNYSEQNFLKFLKSFENQSPGLVKIYTDIIKTIKI